MTELSALRTMNLGVSLVERPIAGPLAPPPGVVAEAQRIFAGLTWDKTRLFYDVYRENLTAMYELARDAGTRVVLATVLGNDFDPPMVSTPPAGVSEATQRQLAKLRREALDFIPRRFCHGVLSTGPDEPVIRLRPTDWGESVTKEVLAERRTAATPHELPAHCPTRATGRRVLEVSLAAAGVHAHETRSQIYARQLDDGGAGLRQTLRADPAAAGPHCALQLGLCTYLVGEDDARARELLLRRRSTRPARPLIGIVRAAPPPPTTRARFVDIAGSGRCRREGWAEVMMDNCLHETSRAILVDSSWRPSSS